MDYRKIIKEIGRGKNHARDLDRDTARGLYAHMLNGEVPDLELGGVLIALRIKGEGEAEMLGFYEAMQNHTIKLTPPAGKPMPISRYAAAAVVSMAALKIICLVAVLRGCINTIIINRCRLPKLLRFMIKAMSRQGRTLSVIWIY